MKIVMTGGGSGGHITPILAVAHKIKQLQSDAVTIDYIGQRGDALLDIPKADPNIDAVYTVWAGKFRRYSGVGMSQLFDIRTQVLNLRDFFRLVKGIWQSYWLLGRLQPDVIFTRGGFVSVPVAFAGRLRRIPYITHDSDSTPSLANRIIAHWARLHTVAFPPSAYPYDQSKTVRVGIPLSPQYSLVTTASRQQYRAELGLSQYEQVLFITGGGNGAQRLNADVVANARYLLGRYSGLCIVHLTGRAHEDDTKELYDALGLGVDRSRVIVKGFVNDLYRYSGAADVTLNRGGATNLAEFAVQGIACVVIPATQLSWNPKNAQILADQGAIEQLTEVQSEQPERLGRLISDLFDDKGRRDELGKNFTQFSIRDAAERLAGILIKIATETNKKGGRNASQAD